MFRTDFLSIIRSLNTVFTAIGVCHTEILTVLIFLYNIEFYLEHVLKFNDRLHVSTPVNYPSLKFQYDKYLLL
jgi:hypothetical protein